jgi:hypothetical protein
MTSTANFEWSRKTLEVDSEEIVSINVRMKASDADALVASYGDGTGAKPLVDVARPLARLVIEAIIAGRSAE